MSGQALTLLQAFIFYSGQDNWLWAFAGLAAGMYWFYRGFRLLQRRRLILDIPASKIRSASIGLALPAMPSAPAPRRSLLLLPLAGLAAKAVGEEQPLGKSRRRKPAPALLPGRQHRTRAGRSPGRRTRHPS